MKIVKCDYCGAEVIYKHHDINQTKNPADIGWTTQQGRKLCSLWEKDICPNCADILTRQAKNG